MGKVTVTLNGRAYRLGCGDGEEERLSQLAEYVNKKVDLLAAQFGQVGDDRLTVLAALLITDELFEAREGLDKGEDDGAVEEGADVALVPMAAAAQTSRQAKSDDGFTADDLDNETDAQDGRPEPLLKRALRRSQARAARTPMSLEERLAAAREGNPIDSKPGSN